MSFSFGKTLQTHFSLASDGEFGREEDESDDVAPLPKCTLGKLFAMNHPNLTSVLLDLMYRPNPVQVYAQQALVDETYLKTGHYDSDGLELLTVRPSDFTAFSHVEQCIVAGLQIVYHFARDGKLNATHSVDDANVSMQHSSSKRETNIVVDFRVDGHATKLAVREHGDEAYISLYIED